MIFSRLFVLNLLLLFLVDILDFSLIKIMFSLFLPLYTSGENHVCPHYHWSLPTEIHQNRTLLLIFQWGRMRGRRCEGCWCKRLLNGQVKIKRAFLTFRDFEICEISIQFDLWFTFTPFFCSLHSFLETPLKTIQIHLIKTAAGGKWRELEYLFYRV